MAIRELDAKVAIHGLRIAESQLSKNTVVQNALVYRSQQLLENNDDVASADHLADSLLGMQVAYSAGYLHRELAASVLVSLSGVSRSDYLQTAVLSSVSADNIGAVVDRAVDESRVELLAKLLPMAVRMQQPEAVARGVGRLNHLQESLPSRLQVAANVLRAMQDAQWNDSDTDPVMKMLAPLFVQANNVVADAGAEDAIRVAAAELIAEWARPDSPELQKLVATAMPLEVQKVGVRRLLTSTRSETIEMIWDQWRSHSPVLKDVILDQLLSRRSSTDLLLDAVEAKKLDGNQIGPRHRQKLQLYPDDDVRERANRLLQRQGDSDRKTLVTRYIQAMPAAANLDQGRQLFQKHCVTCHQLGGEGFSVGPDLTALTDKSVAALTTAILDPNNAVEDRFLNYVAVLNNGSQVSGMVVAEAGNGITLRSADGKTTTVFRNELEELIASGASYMPEGFEQQLQPDELANVIHFVQQQKGARKEFVGNQPQVAPVRDDGSIRLFAIHAEIYGPNLVFETQYRNLGYWANEADRAVWQLDVPKAGKYRVYFDAACPDDTAGNHVALTIGGNTLVGQMKSTGGWDSYDWVSMGTIELPGGKCQGTIQSAGPIHGFLMDLRTVILEPVSP
ncbi:MAG: c-type cytochrome [Pirellulaceae bacterium]